MLPRAVRAFTASHPDVRLELITMLSEHQPEQLLAGRIEVGIARYIEPPPHQSSLTYARLFADPFCLAVPAGHPLLARDAVAAPELDGVALATYPRACTAPSRTGRSLSCARRESSRSSPTKRWNIDTALGLVASGLGVLPGGQVRARGEPPGHPLRQARPDLLPEEASTVYAVTRATEPGKALRAFLSVLTLVGEELGEPLPGPSR